MFKLLHPTYNLDVDYSLIHKAVEGLNLTGVKFFFYGHTDTHARFEPLVKAAGADFVFIDKTKKRLF